MIYVLFATMVVLAFVLRHAITDLKEKMMAALDDLQKAVERNTSVTQSVIALIKGFASKFQDAKDDPVRVEQLVAQLNHNADDLAAAVAANTVAEDEGASPTTPSAPTPSSEPSSTPTSSGDTGNA